MPRATTSANTTAASSAATAKAAKKTKATETSTSAKTPTTKAAKAVKAVKAVKAPRTKAKRSSPKGSKGSKATTTASVGPDRTSDDSGSVGDSPFLEAQRAQLLAEREAYARSASSLQAEADQLAQDREPGDVQFDEESGEGDSMNVERERDLVLSAQAMASIEEIDQALARIDQGTYGVCQRCGQPIPEERLKALPYASMCVRCKSGGLGRR